MRQCWQTTQLQRGADMSTAMNKSKRSGRQYFDGRIRRRKTQWAAAISASSARPGSSGRRDPPTSQPQPSPAFVGWTSASRVDPAASDMDVAASASVFPASRSGGRAGLLEANKLSEALTAFEASAKQEPRRFRGVYGAAKTAKLMNDPRAAKYFAELREITAKADTPGRPELAEARTSSAR